MGKARPTIPSMCTQDITVEREQYRYHISSDYIVIKLRTNGKDGKGYGGWSFHSKFSFFEEELALETWRRLYNRRDNGGLHSKDIEVSEGEMMPPESQKPHACSFSPSTVVKFHEAAQQFGRMAVLCAAKAGAELNVIKANCKHGEWLQIVKALPFSADTASRYRKLAEQMTERLLEQGGEIDLLSLPDPEHLAEPEYAETLRRVQHVTGEQGLRQLYFDWGIMRESQKGGDRGGGLARANRTDEEIEEANTKAIRSCWATTATMLNSEGIEEMTWAELERSEIQGLLACCTLLAEKIQSHLTKTR